MRLPSLRARVLVGSALWTIGLLLTVSMVLMHLMYFYPGVIAFVHGVLLNVTVIGGLALIAMIAGAWQMRRSLSAMDQIRARLSSVHRGEASRLTGTYPSEVQPLVDDLNALLEQRDQTVQRALAKAGDLAHGLKTPLAVLSREAERVERDGDCELAASLGREVRRMRTHIDYHLAQARAAASGASPGTRTLVKDSTDGLARTLTQLYAERGLTIEVSVDPVHTVSCQREDLDEMLGNLLDNACKWARQRVIIASSAPGDGRVTVTIDDDGPGLDAAMRDAVLQRGVRADEAVPGTGLGLAIVRDLAEVYQGSIALDRSPKGGLRASLTLPAPPGAHTNA